MRNFGYLLSDNASNVIISLLVSYFVNRYLGVERYGILNYCVALCGLWECLMGLGSDIVIRKEVVLEKFSIGQLRGTGALIYIIGAAISFIGLIVTTIFLKSDRTITICILIISISYFCKITYNIQNIFIAKLQTDLYVKWNIRIKIVVAATKLMLVYLKADIYCFAAIYLFETILQVIMFELLAKKYLSDYGSEISLEAFRHIISQSWAYVLSNIGMVVYMKIDQVMIKHMIGESAVGYYSAAVNLVDYFIFIPTAFANAMLPILTESYMTNKMQFKREYVTFFERMIGIMVLVIATVQLFGKLAVYVIYGSEYMPAIGILRIYAFASLFAAIVCANSIYMTIFQNQIKTLICTCTAAITNVILNAILISSIGVNGAAIATIVSQFIASIGCLFLWENTRELLKIIFESLLFENTRKQCRDLFINVLKRNRKD